MPIRYYAIPGIVLMGAAIVLSCIVVFYAIELDPESVYGWPTEEIEKEIGFQAGNNNQDAQPFRAELHTNFNCVEVVLTREISGKLAVQEISSAQAKPRAIIGVVVVYLLAALLAGLLCAALMWLAAKAGKCWFG